MTTLIVNDGFLAKDLGAGLLPTIGEINPVSYFNIFNWKLYHDTWI